MNLPSLDQIRTGVANVKIAFADAMLLYHAAPKIKAGIDAGRSPLEVLKTDAPEVLAMLEQIANYVAPGSGTAIEVVAFLATQARPMTFEEEQAWMARASESQTSS